MFSFKIQWIFDILILNNYFHRSISYEKYHLHCSRSMAFSWTATEASRKLNEWTKKTVTAKYDQNSQNCEKLPPIVYHVALSVVLHRHEMKISPLSDFMLFHLMLLWMVGFSSRLLLQWYSRFVGEEKKMWMMEKKRKGSV